MVTDIFGAREKPVDGVDSRVITDRIAPGTQVRYEPDFESAPGSVAAVTRPGDLVLTMGAGTVTTLGDAILATLAER